MMNNTTYGISVHAYRNPTIRTNIVDRTGDDRPIRDPYYELHIEDVTFYITPDQLTQLADSLLEYASSTAVSVALAPAA